MEKNNKIIPTSTSHRPKGTRPPKSKESSEAYPVRGFNTIGGIK